jgi:hypothetical protein
MANRDTRFLIKRSNVPGKIPTNGDLLLGELGLNTADAILYTSGTTANTILPIGWDRVSRTGDTMTGGLFTTFLSATSVSATTYYNLPTDIYTTGGTYSNGITTYTNNTGGTFNVSGYTLSKTNIDAYQGDRLTPTESSIYGFFVDKSVNGSIGYLAKNTDNVGNGAIAVLGVVGSGTDNYSKGISMVYANNGYYIPYLRNSGFIFSDSDTKIITKSLDLRTGDLPTSTSKFSISSGGTLSIGIQPTLDNSITDILGRKSDGTVVRLDKSAITTTDIYTTGFTYNNANRLTLINNTGGTLTTDINTMTGLTINGSFISNTISATTYYNLPTDIYTTGVTVSNSKVDFNNSNNLSAYTINFSGININVISDDTNKTLTFSASTGGSSLPTLNQGQIFIGDTSNVIQARNVSGDININYSGLTTIQPKVVTYSKIQDVTTTSILGSTSITGGTIEEIPMIDAYITSGTSFSAITNIVNWDINGVYTGSTLTDTYQGQSCYDTRYWYTAVDDNVWVRLIRG